MFSNKSRAYFRQGLIALAVGIGALNMIMAVAYTSPAIPSMKSDPAMHITDEEGSWIGAVIPGMALIGSLFAGKLVDSVGRKYLLIITTLSFTAGWIGTAFSTNVTSIILSRIIAGASMGAQRVAMLVYMSETIERSICPALRIIPATMVVFGSALSNVLGNVLNWREMACLGALVSSLVILFAPILPESPFYLLKNNRKSDAFNALKWMRENDAVAEKEFEELKIMASTTHTNIKISDLFRQPYRWSFFVGLLCHIFQQTTGFSAFTSFLGTIFHDSGSAISVAGTSAMMSLSSFLLIFITGRLFQRCPRKPFLKLSAYVMIISLTILSGYFWLRQNNIHWINDLLFISYIPSISVITFMSGYSLGWGVIPWMFIGEGLPSNARGQASGIIIATNWGASFLVTKSFHWLLSSAGLYSTFLCYAIVTSLSVILMESYLPETFGMTAAKMDKFYLQAYKLKSY